MTLCLLKKYENIVYNYLLCYTNIQHYSDYINKYKSTETVK